jgi:hypothetical protein
MQYTLAREIPLRSRPSHYSEPQLDHLRQQLAAWRQGHSHQRTPEPVWQEAVQLARALGISRVAQALRLNYTGLKRRFTSRRAPSPSAPAFVEVKCPPPVVPVSIGECRICLQDAAGGQMSVVMATADTAVLGELAQVFWGRGV